jgi:exonuclease SbcD
LIKILHTADWHLGAELKHVSRLSDQLNRIEEILQICDDRQVDLLLVAGDFIDERHSERMTPVFRRFGELLRPRLRRGMHAVILAGNHDREWVFPFLQTARDLFFQAESSNLQFVWKPDLRIVDAKPGERVRLMLLPYPRQGAYDLEAITFKDAADRHRQMGDAVKQRIRTLESEIKKDPNKMPTVVVGHLLIAGQKENGRELTEEADVPIPRVYLPNYAYVALGHVHLPTELGSVNCRYSGSIERMDFGGAYTAEGGDPP